jgi:hypothetical protein
VHARFIQTMLQPDGGCQPLRVALLKVVLWCRTMDPSGLSWLCTRILPWIGLAPSPAWMPWLPWLGVGPRVLYLVRLLSLMSVVSAACVVCGCSCLGSASGMVNAARLTVCLSVLWVNAGVGGCLRAPLLVYIEGPVDLVYAATMRIVVTRRTIGWRPNSNRAQVQNL